MAKVAIVGQGYVGLPMAMRAVEAGFDVVGLEVDGSRVERLQAGHSYVEDVPNEQLCAALATGRYLATDDDKRTADFDVAVITVPTPLREGVPDLSYVAVSATMIAPHLTLGSTVILESTTYPGTTEERLLPILEEESGLVAGRDFNLGYSPERIDPGNSTWNLRNTPKVVSGINAESLAAVKAFYDAIVERTVPVSSPRVAELTKVLENTFRHVNIALVNELAMFAADLGVDVWEAIQAASTKPFGFMPFTPGPGVGGHCLPIDPSYLSWRVKQTLGTSFRFIELANDVNDHMPDYVVRRVIAGLNRQRKALNGSRALVLGLAYKKNSGDGRESPGPVVCERLATFGAEVHAADPYLPAHQFPPCTSRVDVTEAELRASDVVVIVTDHDAFDWPLVSANARYVLDARHRLAAQPNIEYL